MNKQTEQKLIERLDGLTVLLQAQNEFLSCFANAVMAYNENYRLHFSALQKQLEIIDIRCRQLVALSSDDNDFPLCEDAEDVETHEDEMSVN